MPSEVGAVAAHRLNQTVRHERCLDAAGYRESGASRGSMRMGMCIASLGARQNEVSSPDSHKHRARDIRDMSLHVHTSEPGRTIQTALLMDSQGRSTAVDTPAGAAQLNWRDGLCWGAGETFCGGMPRGVRARGEEVGG